MSEPTAIVWFRRDLRLTDNPALSAALARAGRIVALYVHSPDEESPWRPGAASNWWLHHSLAALEGALRERGLGLTVRQGAALGQLLAVAAETGARHVYWNRLYEPAIVARDAGVEAGLRAHGLESTNCNATLLHEPWEVQTAQGGPYRVFTPYWRACLPRLDALPAPTPAPERLQGPRRPPGSVPLDALGLLPSVRWDAGLAAAWHPGEAAALARLEQFCDAGLAAYAEGRNRPDPCGSSRLSPHLHFGEVGPGQCVAAARNAVVDQPAAGPGAAAFVRELGWREFAHHLLHHCPQTTDRPLDGRFERYQWARDEALLRAWQHGRTGFPLVDAGLRELWHTGWMHNRVRMIAASLLAKNLRQPWQLGARWFWDTLVDADLASNTLGWQWTAGCGADAAPFFRIFNPVLQAERYDPERRYLRRWLPELARLPDAWIHRPWQAPPAALAAAGVQLGINYPRPVVDLAASRAAALDAYAAMRGATVARA